MRFWLALVLFVGGLAAGSVGVVNQVENTPIDTIIASQELDQPTTYVMIPNKLLTAYSASPKITVRGGEIFVATGRQSDIEAWLEGSPYVELRLSIDVARETAELAEVLVAGSGNLTDPNGSDIWKQEINGRSQVTLNLEQDNQTAILVASNGLELAPRSIAIEWDIADEEVEIPPITYVGVGLMALGSIAGLWAAIGFANKYRSSRRRGPKPPRRRSPRRAVSQAGAGPRRGRRAMRPNAFIAIGLSTALLSGCVAEYENPVLSPSPLSSTEILTPALTRDQVSAILFEIAEVVRVADENNDRESLETRVTGPALEMRRFAYNLISRLDQEESTLEPLLAGPIQLFLPPATDSWPRNVMVVTGEEQLQMLVLRQETVRDQYKLFQYMSLLPGADFPDVASELTGASSLNPDNKFLLVSPRLLGEAVGDLLNNGADSLWVDIVDPNNDYIKDVASVQRGLAETLSNANLDFQHEQTEDPMVLLSSLDGGALVGIYMIDTYTIIPKEPGDAVAIAGDEAVLLGTSGSATGIETRYGAMLLFHIPVAGGDAQVRLLGATQQLLTAVALGS
jgi:hypothetical protein